MKKIFALSVVSFSLFTGVMAQEKVGIAAETTKLHPAPINKTDVLPAEPQIKPVTISGQLFNRVVTTIQSLPLIGFIDEWYFTRYRMGGTTKKGVDCSSFTMQLFQEVYKINLPRTARQQFEATMKISEDEIKEGDLVFFNTRGGVSHVGVYLVNGYFVHASSSRGVVVSNLREPYFNKRFLGARRIVGPQIFLSDLL